jgi:carboxyl-terminal processing protease
LVFLEAWRVVDRAYVDKSFNGQTWFRYREDALRNEPMKTREQTRTCLSPFMLFMMDRHFLIEPGTPSL